MVFVSLCRHGVENRTALVLLRAVRMSSHWYVTQHWSYYLVGGYSRGKAGEFMKLNFKPYKAIHYHDLQSPLSSVQLLAFKFRVAMVKDFMRLNVSNAYISSPIVVPIYLHYCVL